MNILFNIFSKSDKLTPLAVNEQGFVTMNGKTYRVVIKRGDKELTGLHADVRQKIAEKTVKILKDAPIQSTDTLENVKITKESVQKGDKIVALAHPKLHKKRFTKIETFATKVMQPKVIKPHPVFTDEAEKQAAILHKEFSADKPKKPEVVEGSLLCTEEEHKEAVELARKSIAGFEDMDLQTKTRLLQIILTGNYNDKVKIKRSVPKSTQEQVAHQNFLKDISNNLKPNIDLDSRKLRCTLEQLRKAIALAREIKDLDAIDKNESTELIKMIMTAKRDPQEEKSIFEIRHTGGETLTWWEAEAISSKPESREQEKKQESSVVPSQPEEEKTKPLIERQEDDLIQKNQVDLINWIVTQKNVHVQNLMSAITNMLIVKGQIQEGTKVTHVENGFEVIFSIKDEKFEVVQKATNATLKVKKESKILVNEQGITFLSGFSGTHPIVPFGYELNIDNVKFLIQDNWFTINVDDVSWPLGVKPVIKTFIKGKKFPINLLIDVFNQQVAS